MKVFIAGRAIKMCPEGIVWEVLGAFSTPTKAEAACYDDTCFVGPLEMDEQLPKETMDWPGLYFPIALNVEEHNLKG